MSEKYEREAFECIPAGYYRLTAAESIRPDDLLWSWTSSEWLRSDSPLWMVPSPQLAGDVVCAIRKAQMSEFERSIPTKRVFTLRG